AVVIATAITAAAAHPLRGCGKRNLIDGHGSWELARALQLNLPNRGTVRICEGWKDNAPRIPEGTILGRAAPGFPNVDLALDPVEGTGALADASIHRGSMVLVSIFPDGSLPKLYYDVRASKLIIPPGVPIGGGHLSISSSPGDVIAA